MSGGVRVGCLLWKEKRGRAACCEKRRRGQLSARESINEVKGVVCFVHGYRSLTV